MPKVARYDFVGTHYEQHGWDIRCPGCNRRHLVHDDGRWTFNGDVERPTFKPSINICCNPKDHKEYRPECPTTRCHFVITDGEISFGDDSTHALAGQKVPLPDL